MEPKDKKPANDKNRNGEDKAFFTDEETKEKAKTSMSAYMMISQVGLVMVVPIILGAAIGHWLDQKLGTGSVLSVILLLAGIAGGFYSAYHQIASVINSKGKK